jgi:hypothetical protein
VPSFFDEAENKILSFWRLPSNTEILELQLHMDKFKEVNLPDCFNYDLGNSNENKPAEFASRNSLELIRKRLPKLTLADSIDADAVIKEKGRLVEFEQAYDYNSASNVVRFLRYWKQVSNIFDLEFFMNKLASSAFVIANVEKMVLSGVPFYDDEGDDSNFVSDLEENESDQEEEDAAAKKKAGVGKAGRRSTKMSDNKFDDAGHNPLKNVLATTVAEKLAQEKREKMQLMTDLEGIKDKFVAYQAIMRKQEMQSSLHRAEAFLGEVHGTVFYSILYTLY